MTESIIGEKYRDRYKEKDWIGKMIDDAAVTQVTKTVEVKDEEGNVTGTEEKTLKKTQLDLDRLFEFCEDNHIDTSKMKEQRDRKNAPGRIRMTLGNQLRAAAKRRGGLFDLAGDWHDAPDSITKGADPVENPDGSKIAKPKAEVDAEAETEEA